jgi:hypothetical protein
MRETWVPLFQDIRNSSLWAHDSDIRIVWITLMTMVDPEGYIAAAIPGIAIAANVHVDKVREAIAIFEAPDPDSRNDAHEGRRLQKVPRGWLMLTYGEARRRAAHEAEKARKRRYMRDVRSRHSDEESPECLEGFVDGVDADVSDRGETVDASKSKSKSKSPPPQKGEGSPQPPAPVEVQGTPVVFRSLEGWHPSPELRAEAVVAGVATGEFDRRIADLRNGPIGGARGVIDRDAYVRNQFGRWRTWAETDRAKATAAASRPAGGGRGYVPPWEPGAKHTAFAAQHGLPLAELAKDFARRGYTIEHYPEKDLNERFGRQLAREARRSNGRAVA